MSHIAVIVMAGANIVASVVGNTIIAAESTDEVVTPEEMYSDAFTAAFWGALFGYMSGPISPYSEQYGNTFGINVFGKILMQEFRNLPESVGEEMLSTIVSGVGNFTGSVISQTSKKYLFN